MLGEWDQLSELLETIRNDTLYVETMLEMCRGGMSVKYFEWERIEVICSRAGLAALNLVLFLVAHSEWLDQPAIFGGVPAASNAWKAMSMSMVLINAVVASWSKSYLFVYFVYKVLLCRIQTLLACPWHDSSHQPDRQCASRHTPLVWPCFQVHIWHHTENCRKVSIVGLFCFIGYVLLQTTPQPSRCLDTSCWSNFGKILAWELSHNICRPGC